uniref:Chromatin-remodeling ATPase INO80 n=1 Tax=Timema monikensis TaxID=170555 RepID=A0A7R9HQS9_9NEOP|nr:unnamed protein product [Timema monikensis]
MWHRKHTYMRVHVAQETHLHEFVSKVLLLLLLLFQEYMWHRKHTYMRLDGSSKISERRDMVADFQTRQDIFVFLLSTRAGGLGINLTAADTSIWYWVGADVFNQDQPFFASSSGEICLQTDVPTPSNTHTHTTIGLLCLKQTLSF